MTREELSALGREIARDVAAGLMQATAAGAKEFCREMREAREEAETDGLMLMAEKIDAEKTRLQVEIGQAKGLKSLALKKRLKDIEAAEAKMCETVEGQTLAIEHAPEEKPTYQREGRAFRRKEALNGHAN